MHLDNLVLQLEYNWNVFGKLSDIHLPLKCIPRKSLRHSNTIVMDYNPLYSLDHLNPLRSFLDQLTPQSGFCVWDISCRIVYLGMQMYYHPLIQCINCLGGVWCRSSDPPGWCIQIPIIRWWSTVGSVMFIMCVCVWGGLWMQVPTKVHIHLTHNAPVTHEVVPE